MIFQTIFLVLLTTTYGITKDQFEGFVNGLREDLNNPSPCYSGFTDLNITYAEFASNETFTFNLHVFQTLVNEFTTTVSVCQIQPLFNTIYEVFIPENMNAMTVYVLVSLNQFMPIYDKYLQATNDKNEYLQGFYSGQIFSLLFNYHV